MALKVLWLAVVSASGGSFFVEFFVKDNRFVFRWKVFACEWEKANPSVLFQGKVAAAKVWERFDQTRFINCDCRLALFAQ